MRYTRNHWLEDTVRSNRFKAAHAIVAMVAVSLAITSWGLYVVRVNESRLIVNCASFISSDAATKFTMSHPEYKKRLNPLNKPTACSSYQYGNTH